VGQTFNVVDGGDVTTWQSAGDHLRLVRSARPRLPVPYALAMGIVPIARSLLGLSRRRGLGALVAAQFEARFRPVRAEPRAAREILGWRPPWTYEQALRRCSDAPSVVGEEAAARE
jgi:nucleoside-diphosphate-sugar epimerase